MNDMNSSLSGSAAGRLPPHQSYQLTDAHGETHGRLAEVVSPQQGRRDRGDRGEAQLAAAGRYVEQQQPGQCDAAWR